MKLHTCKFCSFESQYKWVVRRHLGAQHEENIKKEAFPVIVDDNHNISSNNVFDIRFLENFKLFISGPSR